MQKENTALAAIVLCSCISFPTHSAQRGQKYISYLKNLHEKIELRMLVLHLLPGLNELEIARLLVLFCFVFNVQLYRICNICALFCYNASSESHIGP